MTDEKKEKPSRIGGVPRYATLGKPPDIQKSESPDAQQSSSADIQTSSLIVKLKMRAVLDGRELSEIVAELLNNAM